MARTHLLLRKADTIFDELHRLQQTINRRAYEVFQNRGALSGHALADWLTAERELVWKPAVEVRQRDNQFEVLAALPGVEAKDLDVQVTPEDLLIKADVDHAHPAEKGTVHVCEFEAGRLFRSIHFPEKIDPDSVTAEYRNGLLVLKAAIAKTTPQKIDIQAA